MPTQPKITLVTAASRGLGRNTVLHLAEKGLDLVITYHSNAAEADSVVTAATESGASAVALQRGPTATRSSPCLMRSSAGPPRPVVVVSHSMGAQVTELVAACRPHNTAGLVLVTPIPLKGCPLSAEQAIAFDSVARNRDPTVAAAGRKR
jgi:NAD(P)-dependent dehydrogenase (short-subunit alcohol dehydrogenase family)